MYKPQKFVELPSPKTGEPRWIALVALAYESKPAIFDTFHTIYSEKLG